MVIKFCFTMYYSKKKEKIELKPKKKKLKKLNFFSFWQYFQYLLKLCVNKIIKYETSGKVT